MKAYVDYLACDLDE